MASESEEDNNCKYHVPQRYVERGTQKDAAGFASDIKLERVSPGV